MNNSFREKGVWCYASPSVPDKPTILLLHGLSGNARAWDAYIKEWEGVYNLIVIDLPVHGKSSRLTTAHTPEAMADIIAAVIEEIKPTQLFVVSHCFGTLVALELVAKVRVSIGGILFINPMFAARHTFIGRLFSVAISFFATISRWLPKTRYTGNHYSYDQFGRYHKDWYLPRIFKDVANIGFGSYVLCLCGAYKYIHKKVWQTLKDYEVPMTILHARDDKITPLKALQRALRKYHVSIEIIEVSGNHLIVLNDPKSIIECTEDMIAGTLQHE